MSVVVCVLAHGAGGYANAAREAVTAALCHTDFPVCFVHDSPDARVRHPRLKTLRIDPLPPEANRADRFLCKFKAIRLAMQAEPADLVLLLDADAAIVRPLQEAELRAALGDGEFAMVEQTTVSGSTMSRDDFLAHYRSHAIPIIDASATPPGIEAFRYFNSGVVLGRRAAFEAFTEWAMERCSATPTHEIGGHVVADQDYFQFWMHQRRPGSCTELSWEWNHCRYWDGGFPRAGARIAHFSNFLEGPTFDTVGCMSALWQGYERNRSAVARAQEATADETTEPLLTFIVVSHQSAHALDRCLRRLHEVAHSAILVVDNASGDGSDEIAQACRASAVRLPVNLGFAQAANLGAATAGTPLLCFLNPDADMTPDVVAAARAVLAREPRAACVPSLRQGGQLVPGRQPGYTFLKIVADMLETNGLAAGLARRLRAMPSTHDISWSWPLGTCLFARTALFEELGGFDDSYFLYMEDVDLGRRLARAGGRVELLDAEIEHAGCAGSSVPHDWRTRQLNGARLRYALRHHGRLRTSLLMAYLRRAGVEWA